MLASFHQHKHVWDFLGGHIWHHVFLINTYLAKFELKKDSLCGSLECPNPVERGRNLRNLKFMELRMKFLKAFGTIYNFICECDRNIYRDSALLFSLTLLTFFSLFFLILLAIGRNLIPRYFRSIFEGGVKELYYHVVQPKESYHNNTSTITLDCENTTMITHHKMPVFTKVCITGGLLLVGWS